MDSSLGVANPLFSPIAQEIPPSARPEGATVGQRIRHALAEGAVFTVRQPMREPAVVSCGRRPGPA
jgi:hypothetical protein